MKRLEKTKTEIVKHSNDVAAVESLKLSIAPDAARLISQGWFFIFFVKPVTERMTYILTKNI